MSLKKSFREKPSLVLGSILVILVKVFSWKFALLNFNKLSFVKNKLYRYNKVLVEILGIIVLNFQWKE